MDLMALVGVVLGSTVVATVINVAHKHWAESRWSSRAREILQLRDMLDQGDIVARDRLNRLADELIAGGYGSELREVRNRKEGSDVLPVIVSAAVLVASLIVLAAYDAYQFVSEQAIGFSDPVRFALFVVLVISSCFTISGIAVFFVPRLFALILRKLGFRKETDDDLPGERAGDAPDPGEQGEKVDGEGE